MDNYAAAGRLVPKDERMPASKDYAPVSDPAAESPNELPRSRSPDFYRMLFAKEGSGTRDGRSGNSPWWWAAEILSLLLGFAFILPIVEGLSQLKWMWFMSRRPKPLIDFQLFDEASRGSWGCLKSLVRGKGLLACLGACITLSSLLTSTITQQAIQSRERKAEASGGIAEVARATVFSLYNRSGQVLGPYDTSREKQALLDGAFFTPNETVVHIAPVCSSGDCRWDSYGSLAVCSDIVNLTEAANQTFLDPLRASAASHIGQLLNTTVSSGDHIAYGSVVLPSIPPIFPVMVDPVPRPTGAFNASVSDLIVNDHIVAYSNSLMDNSSFKPAQLQFLEHVLYWCTQSLSTSVHDGVATTTETAARAEAKNPGRYPLNFAWATDFDVCYTAGTCNDTLGGLTVQLEPALEAADGDEYVVDVWTSTIASALITESMYGSVLVDRTRGFVASSGGGLAQAFAIASCSETSWRQTVRQADTRYALGGAATATVAGTVLTPQTFVQVDWLWLAMQKAGRPTT
ncbi:hypothetical protein NKR23_g10502 [Pleurostoma richardsiae]|uniref:Uncharacterized protein n=1 Tax=Pleurostoma richardsiae TaxID=41990 RepID=A0AA38RCK9_9PEZI|nr:hypothetical protein NKR23_g10502 [Pleurostoma richardsiae]